MLCDRIAIMVNGKIKCLGTPSQLKTEYAKGYYITMIKKEGQPVTQ